MEMIAEGVETRAQADALHALGRRRGQGFLHARPLPAEKRSASSPTGADPFGGINVTTTDDVVDAGQYPGTPASITPRASCHSEV